MMIKMTMPLKGNESLIDIIKDAFRNGESVYITVKGNKYNATPIKVAFYRDENKAIIYDCEFDNYLIGRPRQ